AFILSRQDQEDEAHGQREDQVVPDVLGRLDLHEIDFAPFEPHPGGQDLIADPLHLFDALSGGYAGLGGPENGGGGIHVVAADVDRPADLAHAQGGAQRHHFALGVAYLEKLDLARIVAKLPSGLDNHLPGAAEAVEIVDVKGAEINLQRVENVLGIDSHRFALFAIEVGVELRHIGPEDTG